MDGCLLADGQAVFLSRPAERFWPLIKTLNTATEPFTNYLSTIATFDFHPPGPEGGKKD